MTGLASALIATLVMIGTSVAAQSVDDYRSDALSIEPLINAQYGYLDRFANGQVPLSDQLRSEAVAVTDQTSLLRFAERALLVLADHHAITGSSFSDSWAVVPSYADLWIEMDDTGPVITAVRAGSPAAQAGLQAGDRPTVIEGQSVTQAITDFWKDLGLEVTPERAGFAARILFAGCRDRPRHMKVRSVGGELRSLTVASLYDENSDQPAVEMTPTDAGVTIRFNDSLGNSDTIAAFDAAMMSVTPEQTVILDLTDTPGGGNTVVARAIMGWFADRPTAYQVHTLPAEERETGIPRQWIEQVLPRDGKYHVGPVRVLVGRWTGSMGEGLAIGMDAIGADVIGGPMAGLRGAIYDLRLEHSGLVLKLPVERLSTVDGIPRERFVPERPPAG